MPIENRNLEPGSKLVASYKKETYRAEVIAGEEGKVLYRLEDGQEFNVLFVGCFVCHKFTSSAAKYAGIISQRGSKLLDF